MASAKVKLTMFDAEDREVRVVALVHPGSPERGPTYACAGEPAEPPEVEVLQVVAVDEGADTAEVAKRVDEIEEAALEQAADDEADAWERELEYREDARHEREV